MAGDDSNPRKRPLEDTHKSTQKIPMASSENPNPELSLTLGLPQSNPQIPSPESRVPPQPSNTRSHHVPVGGSSSASGVAQNMSDPSSTRSDVDLHLHLGIGCSSNVRPNLARNLNPQTARPFLAESSRTSTSGLQVPRTEVQDKRQRTSEPNIGNVSSTQASSSRPFGLQSLPPTGQPYPSYRPGARPSLAYVNQALPCHPFWFSTPRPRPSVTGTEKPYFHDILPFRAPLLRFRRPDPAQTRLLLARATALQPPPIPSSSHAPFAHQDQAQQHHFQTNNPPLPHAAAAPQRSTQASSRPSSSHAPAALQRSAPGQAPQYRSQIHPSTRASSSSAPTQLCLLCGRDLGSAPHGLSYHPRSVHPVVVLPCAHSFHVHCLRAATPQDQRANPPCYLCVRMPGW